MPRLEATGALLQTLRQKLVLRMDGGFVAVEEEGTFLRRCIFVLFWSFIGLDWHVIVF